jgi:hypothetical protein
MLVTACPAIADPFGPGGLNLVYLPTPATLSATVYSRGENNRDDGPLLEEHRVLIQGAVPGTRRTWQKLRIIVEVLANHLETGGSVAGRLGDRLHRLRPGSHPTTATALVRCSTGMPRRTRCAVRGPIGCWAPQMT